MIVEMKPPRPTFSPGGAKVNSLGRKPQDTVRFGLEAPKGRKCPEGTSYCRPSGAGPHRSLDSWGLRPRLLTFAPSGLKRPGATLVEVLVAIFVMAIGLLALLSLFPLGIIRMAQAIQDGRTAQTAANAEELALCKQVRYDAKFQGLFTTPHDPLAAAPIPGVDPEGPSYHVLVDPMGYISASATGNFWVGDPSGTTTPGMCSLKRETVSYVGVDFARARRWYSLLDDLTFDIDGRPLGAGGSTVEREINYSWAYLVHRPRAAEASVVDLSVVVFKNRSVSLSGDLTLGELSYTKGIGGTMSAGSVTYNTANNTVLFDYSGSDGIPPPLRPGDWILDCTPVYSTVNVDRTRNVVIGGPAPPVPMPPAPQEVYRTAHCEFYRVVAVDEISDHETEVEVDTPFRGFYNSANPGQTVFPGAAVVLENVAEVYPKGPGRRP